MERARCVVVALGLVAALGFLGLISKRVKGSRWSSGGGEGTRAGIRDTASSCGGTRTSPYERSASGVELRFQYSEGGGPGERIKRVGATVKRE